MYDTTFDDLRDLEQGWYFQDQGKPIDESAIRTAESVHQRLVNDLDLERTDFQISPIANGSLQVEYHDRNVELEVEYSEGGDVSVFSFRDDESSMERDSLLGRDVSEERAVKLIEDELN